MACASLELYTIDIPTVLLRCVGPHCSIQKQCTVMHEDKMVSFGGGGDSCGKEGQC
jgi:hypothetical protein